MSVQDPNFYEEAAITSGSGTSNGGDFIDPPVGDEAVEPPPSSEFEAPDANMAIGTMGMAEFESSAEAQLILNTKVSIEQKLSECAAAGSMTQIGARNITGPGVLGVGISTGGETSGIPGQPALVIYVENEAHEEQVRREIVDQMGVQAASSDDLPIEIEVTGEIEPLSNRSRFRPAPAGVSVGHFRITAGTIGGWAQGRGSRSNRLLMVSNNHVLANSNGGSFGDSIIQPGTADRGVNPQDRIAILERFVPINFTSGSINYVDCATGWCWPSRIRRDHVYHSGSTPRYFKVGTTVLPPRVNMVVGKSGRTTNLTRGLIQAVGVSVNVNFGSAGVAHFRDQFSVRSTSSSNFSAGGDSGSFVWAWQQGIPPVGLLFAGGGGTTFCNLMSRVVAALDVTLI